MPSRFPRGGNGTNGAKEEGHHEFTNIFSQNAADKNNTSPGQELMILRPRVPQKVKKKSSTYSYCNMTTATDGKPIPRALRHPQTYQACAAADRFLRDRHRQEKAAEKVTTTNIYIRNHNLTGEAVEGLSEEILRQVRKNDNSIHEMEQLSTILQARQQRANFNVSALMMNASKRSMATRELLAKDATAEIHEDGEAVSMFMFPLVFIRLKKKLEQARTRIAERNLLRAQNAFANRVALKTKRAVFRQWLSQERDSRMYRRSVLRRYFGRMQSFKAVMEMQRRLAWAALERLIVNMKARRILHLWNRTALVAKALRKGKDAQKLLQERSIEHSGWEELDPMALAAARGLTRARGQEEEAVGKMQNMFIRGVISRWKLYAAKEITNQRRCQIWTEKRKPKIVLQFCWKKWCKTLQNANAVSFYITNLERQVFSKWMYRTANSLQILRREELAETVAGKTLMTRAFSKWKTKFRDCSTLTHLGTIVAIQNRTKMLPYALALTKNTVGSAYVSCFLKWRSFVERRKAYIRFIQIQHVEYCRALAARAFAVLKTKGRISWETGHRAISDTSIMGASAFLTDPNNPANTTSSFLSVTGVDGMGQSGMLASASQMDRSSLRSPSPNAAASSIRRNRSPTLRGKSRGGAGGGSIVDQDIRIVLARPISSAQPTNCMPLLTSGAPHISEWSLRHPMNWTALRGIERQLRSMEFEKLPKQLQSCLRLLPVDGIPSIPGVETGVFIHDYALREVEHQRKAQQLIQRKKIMAKLPANSPHRMTEQEVLATVFKRRYQLGSPVASPTATAGTPNVGGGPKTDANGNIGDLAKHMHDPSAAAEIVSKNASSVASPIKDVGTKIFSVVNEAQAHEVLRQYHEDPFDGGYLLSRVVQALMMYGHVKKLFIAAQNRSQSAVLQFTVSSSTLVARALEKQLEEEAEAGGLSEERQAQVEAMSFVHLQSQRQSRIQEFLDERAAKVRSVRAKLRKKRMESAPQRFKLELPPTLMRMDLPDVPKVVQYLNTSIGKSVALLRTQLLHERLAMNRWSIEKTIPKCNLPVRPPKPPPKPKKKKKKVDPKPPVPKFTPFGQEKKSPKPRRKKLKELFNTRYAIPEKQVQLVVERAARKLLSNGLERNRSARKYFHVALSEACLIPKQDETHIIQASTGAPDQFTMNSTGIGSGSSSTGTRRKVSPGTAATSLTPQLAIPPERSPTLSGSHRHPHQQTQQLRKSIIAEHLSSPRHSVISMARSDSSVSERSFGGSPSPTAGGVDRVGGPNVRLPAHFANVAVGNNPSFSVSGASAAATNSPQLTSLFGAGQSSTFAPPPPTTSTTQAAFTNAAANNRESSPPPRSPRDVLASTTAGLQQESSGVTPLLPTNYDPFMMTITTE